MKIRAIVLDDENFSCEFHAEACSHRKKRIIRQYREEVKSQSIDDLCSELEASYKAEAEDGWGFWQVSEIKVTTQSGSLFRVFPCIKTINQGGDK